jgi:hypothetical protein
LSISSTAESDFTTYTEPSGQHNNNDGVPFNLSFLAKSISVFTRCFADSVILTVVKNSIFFFSKELPPSKKALSTSSKRFISRADSAIHAADEQKNLIYDDLTGDFISGGQREVR